MLALTGPFGDGSAPVLFRDVSERALPGVSTTCGSPDKHWIVEVNGGGLALGDFDGDGDIDLVLVDGSTLERVEAGEPGFPPRLFLNQGDGTFQPAGEAWAMAGGRWGMGCATGDVDGDGWLDLLVTEWGRDRLFLNQGGKGFREERECGLAGERWGTSAAFLDQDGDGVLDLYVAGYLAFDTERVAAKGAAGCTWKGHAVMCGPEGLVPVHDQFYRGLGKGRFEDVSAAVGILPEAAGYGLGVMVLDYDGDGDSDVYVANDSTPNFLWENQGDGTFEEVGFQRGVGHDAHGKEQAGMGIAAGDVNGDGRPDVFVTNFSGESNVLYRSSRTTGFRERASTLGLGGPSLVRLGWGTGFGDLDLDGRLDLFVLNGHVYPEADRPGTDTSYAQPDQLFLAQGEGFVERALVDGADRVSRAGALADLDGDGDLDLVATAVEGSVRVLENRARELHPERHWLTVVPVGQAIGARISVEWADGSLMREVVTSGGFQAAQPMRAHFGLGSVERLERVRVRWPSGKESVLEDVAVDRVLEVRAP